MVTVWGTLSDRIGRRPIYVLGFFLTSISILTFTTATNVYPGLLLLRLLFAAGSSACTSMLTALLGDCLSNKRGRVAGVVGIFSGLGALLAVGVLLPLPGRLTKLYDGDSVKAIKTSFYIVGGIAMCLSLFLWFTLPKERSLGQKEAGVDQEKKPENTLALLKEGFLASKDPRVFLGYISSFVARADTVVVSTFISLWVAQYYLDNNLCESEGKASCPQAYNIASRLSGVAQTCAIVGAPVFGILSDRLRRTTTTLIAGVVGMIGCFPFAFSKDPTSGLGNLWAVLIGFGQIGMIVTSMILVNGPYVREEIRGSVAGVYSFFGALAVMVINKAGGWLFDEWMQGAPFVILGICHAIIVVFALATRLRENRLEAGSDQNSP
ncbi:MFS general substrate transporter [Basidiobolus meristosporus CBS 931.73]|uniref:MFS general substrate transporter n=1 Tax=Basidiobolus meristosporus CBS 931.73 TaxID=1314790 RepID=A0A1Y1XPH1_9FUNG|nr:MFS general substrate transporter [Basidiobolus meristosporus CBS 931.73]|eukprot:ORX87632.1 MFS general substrate transporter [Basidiobolus meristosporus CBS 931.73]